jgi:Iron-containing redox enzyme
MNVPVMTDRLPSLSFPANLFVGGLEDFPTTGGLIALLSEQEASTETWQESVAHLHNQLDITLAEAYRDGIPKAQQDVQQALFVIYETSLANPLAPACVHEHAPWLVSVRERIERVWLEHEIGTLSLPAARESRTMSPDEVGDWFIGAAAEQSPLDREVMHHLEHAATLADIKTFVLADAYLNYRFFDALVLSLIHYLEPVKCEISEHFWEEAGEGAVEKSHTRQFTHSLKRLGLRWDATPGWNDWRPFAGHNLYFCLGLARRHYFKALGSLAMPELFDVSRDRALVNGFARLGFDPEVDFEYYWNHVEADAEHGPGWLNGVILPVVAAQPEAIPELMLGGALRMQAMRRFNEYLAERFHLTDSCG